MLVTPRLPKKRTRSRTPRSPRQSAKNDAKRKKTKANAKSNEEHVDDALVVNSPVKQAIGVHTDPGFRYGPLNQDRFLTMCSQCREHIFGVFDGHSLNGEYAAECAARFFEEYFREKSLFPPGQGRQALKKTLKKSFLQAHETIIEGSKNLSTTTYEGEEYTLEEKGRYYYVGSKGMVLQDFGTTAIVCAVKMHPEENKVTDFVAAGVGDSVVFIARETESGKLELISDLIDNHGLNNSQEVKRVKREGKVGYDGHYIYPPADSGIDRNCLAMTRALGHRYFSEYGVSPTPSVSNYAIHEQDRFLIICSDGVTDVLSPEKALTIIHKLVKNGCNNMQSIAEVLIKKSLDAWWRKGGIVGNRKIADNATIVVIDLKNLS